MVRAALVCFALACVSAAAPATEIHKCATPIGIAYQSAPCSGVELPKSDAVAAAAQAPPPSGASAAETSSAPGSGATSDAVARGAPSCDARAREPRRLPWRQATICIGMTDDEVLNLPGWGRPAKIVRTRAPREWREQWIYDARFAGPRQLFFVNGKLNTVEREFVETPAGQLAKLGGAFDTPRGATN